MAIGLVHPFLNSIEYSSVPSIHDLRNRVTVGVKFLDLVLCWWCEDIQRLISFRVRLTLWKKCVCMKMCLFWLVCVSLFHVYVKILKFTLSVIRQVRNCFCSPTTITLLRKGISLLILSSIGTG